MGDKRGARGFWKLLWSRLGEGGSLAETEAGPRLEREREMTDALAAELSRSGLEAAGIFVAETTKPLSGLAAHMLRLLTPAAGPVLGARRMSNLACLLEDRDNLERFIQKLEALEERRGSS